MNSLQPTRLRRAYLALCQRVLDGLMMGGNPLTAFGRRGARLDHAELARRLTGRNVLITGASSGIGRATALKAARAGAVVLLVARSESKLRALCAEIERAGGQARVYPTDLSSAPDARALLERLRAESVHVDVLINSAGRSIRRPVAQSWDRVHDYERTMALNYFGSLRLILGLVPGMVAQRSGHVVNVSSAGVQVGTPMFSAYIASKSALDAFTLVAASETRSEGVRFTTVHMPLVRTPMILPTESFRHVDALSPEQAADLVLRALITQERQLGTRLGRLLGLAHILMPERMEQMLSLGHDLGRNEEHGALCAA